MYVCWVVVNLVDCLWVLMFSEVLVVDVVCVFVFGNDVCVIFLVMDVIVIGFRLKCVLYCDVLEGIEFDIDVMSELCMLCDLL